MTLRTVILILRIEISFLDIQRLSEAYIFLQRHPEPFLIQLVPSNMLHVFLILAILDLRSEHSFSLAALFVVQW